jgi:hypothetical protein
MHKAVLRASNSTDMEAFVVSHTVGSLLKTIEGISAIAVGRVPAAVGDPGRLRSAGALPGA